MYRTRIERSSDLEIEHVDPSLGLSFVTGSNRVVYCQTDRPTQYTFTNYSNRPTNKAGVACLTDITYYLLPTLEEQPDPIAAGLTSLY